MRYSLFYLPLAADDILEITDYISGELKNPDAARKLLGRLINKIEYICEFPYSMQVYVPIRKLEKEYRRIVVGNFSVFYYIEERKKEVVVSRVLYSGREKF